MNDITEARRKAIVETIKPIGTEVLKELGENIFASSGSAWGEKFFGLLAENPGATFHHATTHDGIQIIYCHAINKGMWFIPGQGMGPLQEKGLRILKKIVEGGA